jgi:hypothetical protein
VYYKIFETKLANKFAVTTKKMKRFLFNIALFLLPILASIIWLFQSDYQRSFAYYFVKNDCFNQGEWIYDRLYDNAKPVDIAFIGTSHTINGVHDILIEKMLNEGRKTDTVDVLSVAYCRHGSNMHYLILKELLKNKKPKILIVEVLEEIRTNSHPIFPYFAQKEDLNLDIPFHRDYFKDYYTATTLRIEQRKKEWLYEYPNRIFNSRLYGNLTFPDTFPKAELAAFSERHLVKIEQNKNRFFKKTGIDFPKLYLQKIKTLCDKNNVELKFLYLPAYGGINVEPTEMQLYQDLAAVLLPPKDILNNPDYWHDTEHLNTVGAEVLGKWLAEQF